MEFLDFLILGVGCIIIFEAARRFDLLAQANKMKSSITNTSEDGIVDNCRSYKILWKTDTDAEWSPGVGSVINTMPFVLFMIIILTLVVFGTLLSIVPSYTRMPLLIVGIVFALALHSGPDSFSRKERYLQVIVNEKQDELNGHDLKILTDHTNSYKSWPWFQVIFGLLLATSVFWPDSFYFIGFVIVLISGFCFLGSMYSIHKGVFHSEF